MHPEPPPPSPPVRPPTPVNPRLPLRGDANLRLNDDILREIFRRIDNPKSLITSMLACKSFFRIISTLGKSFFIGFYHTPNPNSPLPQYIHTQPDFTNPNLNLQFLRSSDKVHYKLLESRAGHVLLFKMIHGPDLHFVLVNPFNQSCVSIEPVPPPLYDPQKHSLIICSYAPLTHQQNGEFKIIVIFSDKKFGCEFTIMAFSSETGTWTIHHHDDNDGVVFPKRGYQEGLEPTVYAERMLYKLQNSDYILAVDPNTLQLSKIDLPIRGPHLVYYGNHCIGRTEEGKLCFFLLKTLSLFIWVLDNNKNTGPEWIEKEIVHLNGLMDPGVMGELVNMEFSADVWDQSRGYKLASVNGFGEETCVLMLVLRDWVVSFEVGRKKMKLLWYSDELYTRVEMVYPYEMQWPPVVMANLQEMEAPVESGRLEEGEEK